MSRLNPAGAAASVLGPLAALVSVLVAPTFSDEAANRAAALADHWGASVAAMVLQFAGIALFVGGIAALALALAPHAPRLALWGAIAGVAGSLVILFEQGVTVGGAVAAHGLGPARAAETLHRIDGSRAVGAVEPLSLLQAIGFTLLAVAAARAGAPRWASAALVVGAFANTAGFAAGARPLAAAGFVVLLVGLLPIVRLLAGRRAAGVSVAQPA